MSLGMELAEVPSGPARAEIASEKFQKQKAGTSY